MDYIMSFLYEFKNTYTREDQLITVLFSSLFLPYPITALCFILGFIYIVCKKELLQVIRRVKGSEVIILFCIYLMIISLCYQNILSFLLSVGLLIVFICILHYRYFIHKQLFERILDIMLIFSLLSLICGIFQQFYFMSIVKGMGFFDIQNNADLRASGFFLNASYYALMILFVENICIYKFFKSTNNRFKSYYIFIGCVNLFALFLTGSRTPWLCLTISIFSMLFINRFYKTVLAFFGTVTLGLYGLSLQPELLPRLVSQGLDIGRRTQIWNTAKLMVQDSFLFGRGPLAYYMNYESYIDEYVAVYGVESYNEYRLGIASQHSHSFLYEGFISFGFVGCFMLLIYTLIQIKYLLMILCTRKNLMFCSLVVGVLVSGVSSSVIDFPLLWLQTGTFFYMILGSCDMYFKEAKND